MAKYIALSFDQEEVPAGVAKGVETGEKAYAVVRAGEDGFARIESVSRERPPGSNYIEVRGGWTYGSNAHLRLPFDRFYMNEKIAPAAEHAYWQHSRRQTNDAAAAVRVLNGAGVIENVYVGREPIAQFVTHAAQEK